MKIVKQREGFILYEPTQRKKGKPMLLFGRFFFLKFCTELKKKKSGVQTQEHSPGTDFMMYCAMCFSTSIGNIILWEWIRDFYIEFSPKISHCSVFSPEFFMTWFQALFLLKATSCISLIHVQVTVDKISRLIILKESLLFFNTVINCHFWLYTCVTVMHAPLSAYCTYIISGCTRFVILRKDVNH